MNYKRTELGEGIGFTSVIDEKFKTSLLTVKFITPLEENTVSDNALAISLLSDTSADHPTIPDMYDSLIELYTSSLSSSVSKRGNLQILTLSSSWLASKYALYGEDIQGEMLRILNGCIFRPNIKNGEFDHEAFEIGKKELLDIIDSELNSKRSYALKRALANIYIGEPAAINSSGTRESAEAVTPASVYSAYKRLIETAQIEIVFVSADDDPRVINMLREGFSDVERSPHFCTFRSYSPVKEVPLTVKEEFDVNQCKLVIAYKTDSEDRYALRLMDMILGGTPVSKLFLNIREKLSLCYYCSSSMNTVKNTLVIDCGIERGNIEKTAEAINAQIENIKNGDISDDDIKNAVLALENSCRQVGDTLSSYASWIYARFYDDDFLTPEEVLQKYLEVTKERIVSAAKTLRLDCTYLMLDKEGKK